MQEAAITLLNVLVPPPTGDKELVPGSAFITIQPHMLPEKLIRLFNWILIVLAETRIRD